MNNEFENDVLAIQSNIQAGALNISDDLKSSFSGFLEGAENLYSYRTDFLPRITINPGN